MKKMKKIFTVLLALAMVLGMALTASAETTATAPSENDKKEAVVTNVDTGATVTAYQIVKGDYNDHGFVGYVKADDSLAIADIKAPTAAEILAIAKSDLTGLASKSMLDEDNDGTYKAELEAGYWVVLISGGTEIYNPVLVGVYYSVSGSDNTLITNPTDGISADSNWTLNTTNGYAKSSLPTIDKKIVNSDGNENGNHVAIGDTVEFEIDADIPAYSAAYETVKVVISDVLSAGLTLNEESIAITIGGDTYTPAAGVLETANNGFTFTIPSADALANAGEKVIVTYTATVNSSAGLNYNENTNTATLEYTHNPKDANDTTTKTDKTYTYTFGIDADLDGTGTYTTQELFKVGVDENGVVGTVTKEGETVTVTNPLEGATFTLTRADGKVYTATSDENGMLSFTGLDAGTYTLVETVAPDGYSINSDEHTVEISATFNDDGTLASYTITIDEEATSTYSATYSGTAETITKDFTATGITNTKLVSLPSTGGIGTTIFTVLGCLLMIAAAALYFKSRRKEA